ncbi:MAG TPA: PASTA domain-containing protein, partial [Marmoricola sp.]|nr:PASTA domain-containing protein [Marmoricola sp.]
KSIYNDAWTDNWGFVPLTDRELEHMANDLKPILEPKLACFVEIVSIDENDYLGRTYADASSRLQDLGMRTFQAGTVSNDGSNDPGTVASLTTSGQVPKGTRIGLKLYGAAPSTPEPSPTPTKSVTPTPTPTPTVGDAPGDSNGG